MQKNDPVVNVNDVTRISKGASLKGNLVSSTDIRVDGTMDGVVFSEGRIVVGETAAMSGSLLCNNLDMWGKIDGDIYVKDTLSIKNLAVVNGNIFVRKIQVEMGAQINGTCKMITEQEFDKLAAEIVKKAPKAEAKKEA